MTTHRRLRGTSPALALAALGAALLSAAPVFAQRNPSGLPSPRLYTVSPAGGKLGTSFEVTLAGMHFDEPERIVFSHPGIKGDIIPTPPPEIDPKTKKPKAGMAPPAPGLVKCRVTVAPEVPLGNHDVRLIGKWGASNPRAFIVGDLNEVAEKEPNNDVEQAQRVEINTTINGNMASPTDVDYYVIKAAKGQRVLLVCLASTIDSRLQPAIEVYNARDKQIAANRNYNGADALADFTAAEDGDYVVRVFQFTHTFRQPIPGGLPAGATDNFYRLSVTTAPWIDAIFPSVVEPGKTVNVTVYGRNLPGGKLDPTAVSDDVALEKASISVSAPADGRGKLGFSGLATPPAGFLDGFEVRLKNAAGSSNPFLLSLARAPVVLDRGAGHDTPETAQEVQLPCEIAGQVEKRRDRDWYSFTAKKGETWNIEVLSNRLGAPTYMMFLLRNPATKGEMYESQLNENMQGYDRKFFARSEDPNTYRFTAPADGQYQLLVASRAGDTLFGPRHFYQVRITRDEPDFRLVAMSASSVQPDTATLGGGGNQAFTVLIERESGFAKDVELTAEGLPAGVTCPPQVLAAGARHGTLVVSATPDAAPWAGEIKIKGTAIIDGNNKIVREARAASILWPVQPNNGIITISRLDRSSFLAVRGKAPFKMTPTLDTPQVPQGGKAVLTVKVDRLWPDVKGPVQIQTMGGGQGQQGDFPQTLRINNNQPINVTGPSGTLNITVGNDVPPGTYNIVLRGQTQAPFNKDAKSKARQNTFLVQPSAPISFTVLPKSLATFTVSNPSPTVKIGNQVELVVRVSRQFNFKGEFKVQLVLPAGAKGVEAGEVVIPAGKDEAKLVLRVPAGTNPGGRGNLVVRATAMFGKTPVTHEAKLNVNVVK
jgi:hypothetical protein